MPFKSEKQRKYLWANEPEIARDWSDKYGSRVKKASGQLVKPGPGRQGYGGPQDWGAEAKGTGAYAPPDRSPDRGWQNYAIPKPKPRTITRDDKPTITGGASPFGYTRFARPIPKQITSGIAGSNKFRDFLNYFDWDKDKETGGNLTQIVANMPKYWSLPSDLKKAIKSGQNLYFGHGTKTLDDYAKLAKTGFSTARTKYIPTVHELKNMFKGKNPFRAEGVFGSVGTKAEDALKAAQEYAKGALTRGSSLGKTTGKVFEGMIDPAKAYINRGLTGVIQARVPSQLANQAFNLSQDLQHPALNPKNVAKAFTQPGFHKVAGRLLPGANIALGGASALGHIKEGNYGQAAMAGLSMVPGPVGWAGLAGEMGLGALSRMTPIDPNAPENTLVMNKGGIARLPFANGGFNEPVIEDFLKNDPFYWSGIYKLKNVRPYSEDPDRARAEKHIEKGSLGYNPYNDPAIYVKNINDPDQWVGSDVTHEGVHDVVAPTFASLTEKGIVQDVITDYNYSIPFNERNRITPEKMNEIVTNYVSNVIHGDVEDVDYETLENTNLMRALKKNIDPEIELHAPTFAMPEQNPEIGQGFQKKWAARAHQNINAMDQKRLDQMLGKASSEEDVNLGQIPGSAAQRRPTQQSFINRLRNRFYKPATSPAGGYNVSQLNRMNALGGYYSEPVRQQRQDRARVANLLARKAADKPYSQKNLNILTMGSRPGHYDRPGGGNGVQGTSTPSQPGGWHPGV